MKKKSFFPFSRSLCQKFPRKHAVLMTFLSNMLREDGGIEYKRAIVNAMILIIEENPESKEAGYYLIKFRVCCYKTCSTDFCSYRTGTFKRIH